MWTGLRSWWKRVTQGDHRQVRRTTGRLRLERLEDRTLLSAASPFTRTLDLASSPAVQASHFLATPGEVDLYTIHLSANDRVSAAVRAQTAGSGLQSLLRVFDPSGRQVALDDQEGGDPRLTFQAATTGAYIVGVSSAPNDAYALDGTTTRNTGDTRGQYTLNLRRTAEAPPLPDLAGSSFRLTTADTAAYGETVAGTFTVENRGAANAAAFDIQVLVSASNTFPSGSTAVLQDIPVSGLAAGGSFSSGPLTLTLPDAAAAISAGLPSSGPVYVGIQIDPQKAVQELNPFDQSSVHRGADGESLTIVTPVESSGHNHTQAGADFLFDANNRVTGTLAAGQTDWYQIDVSSTGRLTVSATAADASTLVPRLTLAGPNGQVLGQSDVGSLVQHVQPGTYSVGISAPSGAGAYQLLSRFGQGSSPLSPISVGTTPLAVVSADVNGDGIPDLVVVSRDVASSDYYSPVAVLLGNGDGTFQYSAQTLQVGKGPDAAAVADLNGDGRPDLVVANGGDGTVSVLLGNGDGTFQNQQTFAVGKGPRAVAVADVNGDGKPDLIVVNRTDGTVSVLLGNGDGTFQNQQTFAVGKDPRAVAVADVNGDGKPDLFVPNFGDNTVSVLPGQGNGVFGGQQIFSVGADPASVAVVDVNGDGQLDLVTANSADATVSVVLGQTSASFGAQQTFKVGSTPSSVAVADVNGDGTPDLVTANRKDATVSVLLGNGDGTVQSQQTFKVGAYPNFVAVADLNGDGRPDLVVVNKNDNTVSVLLGNGDGSFQPQQTFTVGASPRSVAVADVNGDGIPDLVVADAGDNTVSVLLGNGDGTFRLRGIFRAGNFPYGVAVADVNGDGKPDLVVTNDGSNNVSVLLGNGDGSFQPQKTYAVGANPLSVKVADVNGDGKPDLVVANFSGNSVSVLLGKGDGTFQGQQTFAVGTAPGSVAVADVNGDGKPDLVVSNFQDYTVGVLLGNGDGSFQPQETFSVGTLPVGVAVADLNGDGIPDIVTANLQNSTVSVLLGNGDSFFQPRQTFKVGASPYALAVADLNGDGNSDLVTANPKANTVSVLLGNGNGSFQSQQTYAVGSAPTAVAVADVNHDGISDLLVTNGGDGTVSVLLGNGDGTFQAQPTYAVGSDPTALAVGTYTDSNGKTQELLAVTNGGDGTVSVLLDKGDGTFPTQQTYAVGSDPTAVAVGSYKDSSGNTQEFLAVSNGGDGTVSVLLGKGDGTFQYPSNDPTQGTYLVGNGPTAVAVADINGDGKDDIVVLNAADGTVSELFGSGDGTFTLHGIVSGGIVVVPNISVGVGAVSLAVADLNGDGKPDLVIANAAHNVVEVGLGNGDGSAQPLQSFAGGAGPVALAVADVNGDFKPDLVIANAGDGTVSVLLGNGGAFVPSTAARGVGSRNTPFAVDLNGDGIADSVIHDRSGNILFRAGLPGGTRFAAPVTLNDAAHLGTARPARDLAVVHTGTDWAIAAADAGFDPTLSSTGHFVYTVSLYTVGRDGSVQRNTVFSTTQLPTSITAADLTGNGLDDLIVTSARDNSVTIALQTAPGVFAAPVTVSVGNAPSDVAVSDVNGDGLLDIVVTGQVSGDATVLFNDAGHSFSRMTRFRAGTGLYDLDPNFAVTSLAQTVSVSAGTFTGSGHGNDLVVVDRGSHSLSLLANDGHGGFLDPQNALLSATGAAATLDGQAGPLVAGSFNGPKQPLDLALLMEDSASAAVWIFTGDGHGHFTHTFSIDAGTLPTGLSVVRNAQTGFLDLLVGNEFGDVLRLQGNGDGTFQPPPPFTGDSAQLALAAGSNGQPEVVVTDQLHNKITLRTRTASNGTQFTNAAPLPLTQKDFAPGPVQFSKLEGNHSPFPDAIVVASGSNAVLVYHFLGFDAFGQPEFAAPVSYPVGTNPAGVTIADVNGDAIPDLVVANQGSNDVSILFGAIDPKTGSWVATPGPRLKSGGIGPIAVAVRDITDRTGKGAADGIPDLVVTNASSGTITVLPGVGQGFFNDQVPQSVSVGSTLGTPSIVGDRGVVATGDGRLVAFELDNVAGSLHTVFTAPAGEEVNALQVQADGTVLVAFTGADGTVVQELAPTASGELTPVATFESLSGIPSNPSALQVLQTASGLEVLVTNAGEDQVFVFADLSLPTPPSQSLQVVLPDLGPPPQAVAELAASPETTLFLTVALVPDVGLTTEPVQLAATVASEEIEVADAVAAPGRRSNDVEEEGDVEVASALGGSDNAEEKLRRLDLYEPMPDPDRDGPLPPARQPARVDVDASPLPDLDDVLPAATATLSQPLPVQAEAQPPVRAVTAETVHPPRRVEVPVPASAQESLPVAHRADAQPAPQTVADTAPPSEQARDAAFLPPRTGWQYSVPFLSAVAGTLGLWYRERVALSGRRPDERKLKGSGSRD